MNERNVRVMDSYYASFSSEYLWERIRDESVYLFIRTPMMLELARRKDSGILDFSECMMNSADIEDWLVALKLLGEMGNDAAAQRLIDLYLNSSPHRKSYIVTYIARTVRAHHKSDFKKMILPFAATGSLDVTGWTPTALECLKSVCKRRGIKIVEPRYSTSTFTASKTAEEAELVTPYSTSIH